MCELLVQDRWQVAEACARALGRFKDPRAIPYLIRGSDQHVDWVTTRQCATALGVFAPQRPEVICPALVRALEFGSFGSEAAAQSLQRYQGLALSYLFSALETGALLQGLSQALKAVVMIGDKKALPRLEALYENWKQNLTGPARDQVLAETGKSIAQLNDAPAAP